MANSHMFQVHLHWKWVMTHTVFLDIQTKNKFIKRLQKETTHRNKKVATLKKKRKQMKKCDKKKEMKNRKINKSTAQRIRDTYLHTKKKLYTIFFRFSSVVFCLLDWNICEKKVCTCRCMQSLATHIQCLMVVTVWWYASTNIENDDSKMVFICLLLLCTLSL